MNYNIKDYVSLYKMDEALLKKITSGILKSKKENKKSWGKHSYTIGDTLETLHYDWEFDVCDLFSTLGKELSEEMMGFVWETLRKYCTETNNKLGLENINMGLSWNGFSTPRINWYDKKTKMNEHFDHISSLFDGERKGIPIFTVLGLVKNAKKGGEFCMWGEKFLDLVAGDVLVFPSNFMYRHRVNEITEGERISFVSWAW